MPEPVTARSSWWWSWRRRVPGRRAGGRGRQAGCEGGGTGVGCGAGGEAEGGGDNRGDEPAGRGLEDAGDGEAAGVAAGEDGGDLDRDGGDQARPCQPHHDRQRVDERLGGDPLAVEGSADRGCARDVAG